MTTPAVARGPPGPAAAWATVEVAELVALPADEALARLGSSPGGLAPDEAARRLAQYGPNRIEAVARAPAWLQLLRQFTQLFSVILWCAAALALLAEWSDPGQGMARLAAAIVAVILASGVFAFIQERRVEHTLGALRRLLPQRVACLRGGQALELPVESLVPGDVLLLRAGDIPPADGRVIESFSLRASLATMTGESVAAARDARPCPAGDALRATNLLLAGTAIVSGEARAVVYATAAHTELGHIARLTQGVGEEASPLQRELARLSRVIGGLSVAIGGAMFVAGAALGVPVWQDLIFSIGVIVAMVPEGLLPTLTLSLVLAAQRMARRSVLVRHLPCIETLGSVSVICTDKTGTLTENRLQARELLLGLQPVSLQGLDGTLPAPSSGIDLFHVARLCHDLLATDTPPGPGRPGGDPMDVALLQMVQRWRPDTPRWERVDEVPFDSERMRQSVVCATPGGRVLLCKGAPEAVLRGCTRVRDGERIEPLDDARRDTIARAQEAMATRGLRVLGLAWRDGVARHVDERDECDMVFVGLVGLEDPPRAEVPAAIARCRQAGVRVIMVTGDHPRTAAALAVQVGLVPPSGPVPVTTGDELQLLDDEALARRLDAPAAVFARMSAGHKLRIVQALRRRGEVVAVTGDGVNDAPALKAAHIGVAMGRDGADVARQAADIVLLDDHFASIVAGIEEGRAVFANIRKFLTYVLTHNVAELVPFLAFAGMRIPLPLTPIQALAIDMGTDSLTAVGLGAEPVDDALMRQPPRPPGERLLNLPLALRAYLFLGPIEAAAAMAAYFGVLRASGWQHGQPLASNDPAYLQATTACMAAIVAMQAVNVFLCRSDTRSLWHTGLGGNRWLLAGLALEVALIAGIVYTPWGQTLVGTAALPAAAWWGILPFALALLVLEEGRKAWVRRRPLNPSA